MLRLAQVIDVTGLGKTKIYELQAEGDLPMRVKITSHSVAWVEEEIHPGLQSVLQPAPRRRKTNRAPPSRSILERRGGDDPYSVEAMQFTVVRLRLCRPSISPLQRGALVAEFTRTVE